MRLEAQGDIGARWRINGHARLAGFPNMAPLNAISVTVAPPTKF
jgi:hypothetical protein